MAKKPEFGNKRGMIGKRGPNVSVPRLPPEAQVAQPLTGMTAMKRGGAAKASGGPVTKHQQLAVGKFKGC